MKWSEFFSMGGYAFYVWGSYLVTLLAIGAEIVFLLRRRKRCSRATANSKLNGVIAE